jgi:hypothetical protein
MPERYDLIRAAYDPVRAERLRGMLHAELRDVAPFERKQDNVAPAEEVEVLTKNSVKSKRGVRVLALAAAVAIVGLAATVVAISVRDSDEPGNQSPLPSTATTVAPATAPSTTPPTTTPSTVSPTTVAALSDAEIAGATLLADGEYAPGWVQLTLNGTAPWGAGMKMDAAIAELVPACAPFIDAAFESPNREAAVAYTFFNTTSPSPPSPEPQYVVVFPDEAAAKAMFDAITDPAFLDGCVSGYLAQMTDPAFGDSDFVWFPFFTTTQALDPPTLDLSADQVLVRAYTDHVGTQGTRFVAASMRVGRVVAHIDGETQDVDSNPVLTPEQFQQLASRIIDRAHAALNGQPLPVTVPPSTTPPPPTTTVLALPVTLTWVDPMTESEMAARGLSPLSNDDRAFLADQEDFVDVLNGLTGLHGQAHEIYETWIAQGVVLSQGGQEIETFSGCAETQLLLANDLYQRAAGAKSSLIATGSAPAEINAQDVADKMLSDDPAALDFESVEYKYFILRCGGVPEEQAREISRM